MIKFFTSQKKQENSNGSSQVKDFEYLDPAVHYFDTACQTLRPQPVIDALNDYYYHYNTCGGRVKYPWGVKVDEKVEETRQKLLELAGKSAKDYTVIFTLNTTYGINILLQQLPGDGFDTIITSDIEHNSVFLPTITWSQRHHKERKVLSRDENGVLMVEDGALKNSVVMVNTVSNIDGRTLGNLEELGQKVHKENGVLLLDVAQHFAHHVGDLKKVDFDAVFGAGHKVYGPSVGFIIAKKTFLQKLDPFLLGGGTVTDVQKESYELIGLEDQAHARFELGLQDWAGIIGLGAALDWLKNYKPKGVSAKDHEIALGKQLYEGLQQIPQVTLINTKPAPICSFYSEKIDAHRLALYLGEQNIMCRSGYFCCHYYLKNLKQYPPLLRISLGLHNTEEQVSHLLEILKKIICSV